MSASDDLELSKLSLAGPQQTYYGCDMCKKGILGERFQCLDCETTTVNTTTTTTGGGSSGLKDYCSVCIKQNKNGHKAQHKFRKFEEGYVDLEDFKKSAPFPIDKAFSIGRNLRKITKFEIFVNSDDSDDSDDDDSDDDSEEYFIELSDLLNFEQPYKDFISIEDGKKILKLFEIDNAQKLVNKIIASKFNKSKQILTEMKLVAKYGSQKFPRTRNQIEQRFLNAFSNLEKPKLDDIHPHELFDFFCSLFSNSLNFENADPISEKWINKIQIYLLNSNISVTQAHPNDFKQGLNDIRQILLKFEKINNNSSSDNNQSSSSSTTSSQSTHKQLFVWISPSTNGFICETK